MIAKQDGTIINGYPEDIVDGLTYTGGSMSIDASLEAEKATFVQSAACTVTNGSAANPGGPCTCGNEECTTATGIISKIWTSAPRILPSKIFMIASGIT